MLLYYHTVPDCICYASCSFCLVLFNLLSLFSSNDIVILDQLTSSSIFSLSPLLCRCNIPVVVMGETGCGKTRLIRYMCDLAAQGCKQGGEHVQNMLIMKV